MIVLVGFMGAGKTTVGRLLAAHRGSAFVDTDDLIAARAGASIEDIFATAGEGAFRELEREVVAEVLAGPDAVVALGGGALGDPATCAALEWTTVVHLSVSFAEAMRRVAGGSGRPLLAGDPKELFEERRVTYERVGTVRVDTDGKTPEEVAAEIARAAGIDLGDEDAPQRIPVPLGARSYEVIVGRGLLTRVAGFVPPLPDAAKAMVVSHTSLEPIASEVASSLEARGLAVATEHVPEGEASKDLDQAAALYRALAAHGMHRDDLVVGVGGGVVTDLAGFVASTYHRGVPVVFVPTTLVGQVDAAIGGKTAVNLEAGKNLVGTFHQPRAVVCDVDVLFGLEDAELRSGLAEIVKYGFVSDPSLLEVLEHKAHDVLARDPALLAELVARSVRIKAAIVAADETDRGGRAALNYGHTFAHAIERAAGYGALRHGEAVALGMVAAAHLARELGLAADDLVDLHVRVLDAVGLPVGGGFEMDALEAAWAHDKKYRGGVRFVLLRGPGRVATGVEAPRESIAAALAKMAP